MGAAVWGEAEDARERRVDPQHAGLGRGPDDDLVDVAGHHPAHLLVATARRRVGKTRDPLACPAFEGRPVGPRRDRLGRPELALQVLLVLPQLR
ncbi:MAG: hypothetical protein AAGI30_08445 [Planctomycetota bacterium]